MKDHIAIIGAGAWGTALAIQALRGGQRAVLWARDPARAALIEQSRANERLLPGVALPDGISITADAGQALAGAALILLVVPAQALRPVLQSLPALPAPVLICAKGVEAGSLMLPLEILADMHPGIVAGVLSGPNFAHEIARGLPAAAVVASHDAGLRALGVARLGSASFRLYGGDDPVGAEIGGAAKNVIAIAAGAVMGAGLGENARAALITRGLAEIARLASALGGRADTVAGLSGLGDLLLTATGLGSRNTSLGLALGRGESLTEVLAARQGVTEGVATAPALVERAAQLGVDLPICAAVAELVRGRVTLQEAVARLLARPKRDE
ncbi:MAG: NAD(P)-dependent glycerol-3-phosphate dehydrogenase [Roseomonas sp.]|nr:NAD(P)-dependent glycerol-3-phosphate dehydrogenase [Roseomonas sp.]MCA3369721.1 NAD(P)-dependent glycerol-3-phosphate dehydrogenase [Roseomonas sp.]MCE2759954.1 NAD(P)-dependent glycerol-3-phosphate dehydrogenase [Acetobacteraceae bacterium]